MADRDKRLLIAVVIALLAIVLVGRLAAASREVADTDTRVATSDGVARTAFRGGALPRGVAGERAPRFVLADARGGRVDTRRLRGRPYVVTRHRSRATAPTARTRQASG